ncbi:MAG: HDOD domain-containing protein [Candidatus Sumerlaeia bacterium]
MAESPQNNHENDRVQVIRRARKLARVPLLPESGARILEISRQDPEEVDIAELDSLISHSPSIASRVLRAANSPYYGAVQEITTVRRAIFTIGLQDLMSLIMVTSLMEKFEASTELKEISARELQTHSVAAAAVARCCCAWLSGVMQAPAELHLAALLHDIGKSVFVRSFPAEFDECIKTARRKNIPLYEAEYAFFGIAHDELGGWLAEEWKLPEIIVQGTRHHHQPDQADDINREGVALVAWANRFVIQQEIGKGGDHIMEAEAEDSVSKIPYMEKIDKLCSPHQDEILEYVGKELSVVNGEAQPSLPSAKGDSTRRPASSAKPNAPRPALSSRQNASPGFFQKVFGIFRQK